MISVFFGKPDLIRAVFLRRKVCLEEHAASASPDTGCSYLEGCPYEPEAEIYYRCGNLCTNKTRLFFFLEVNKTVQTLESSGCKGHCSLLKWSFLLIVGVMLWKAQLIKYNLLMQTPTLFLCFYYREHSFRKY